MKISSTDYKSTDTVALMETINQLRKHGSLCFSVGVGCIIGGVSLFDLFGLEDFRILPIIGALIALAMAGYRYYQIFQIKKELSTREISQEEKDTAKARTKKANIKYILILVALLLVCLFCSTLDYGGGNDDRKPGECRICGRKTSLVAGFDMCGSCYESFVDWQEDNWTKKD